MCNGCNNTAATGWTNRLSTSHSHIVGSILRDYTFTLRAHCVAASITYHPRARNQLAYDSSQQWYLTDSSLISHFNLVYPQWLS